MGLLKFISHTSRYVASPCHIYQMTVKLSWRWDVGTFGQQMYTFV